MLVLLQSLLPCLMSLVIVLLSEERKTCLGVGPLVLGTRYLLCHQPSNTSVCVFLSVSRAPLGQNPSLLVSQLNEGNILDAGPTQASPACWKLGQYYKLSYSRLLELCFLLGYMVQVAMDLSVDQQLWYRLWVWKRLEDKLCQLYHLCPRYVAISLARDDQLHTPSFCRG